MYSLIQLFFEIAIFRKGPQDVPASPWLLRLLLPAYVVVNLLILLLNGAISTAMLQIIVDFALMAGFTWPLLYFAGKAARFPQTLGALLGTDTIISLFALPAVASLNSEAGGLAMITMMGLMLWHWLVAGHIFRHALDRPWFLGLGLALLYIMLSSQVMALLFPEIVSNSQ